MMISCHRRNHVRGCLSGREGSASRQPHFQISRTDQFSGTTATTNLLWSHRSKRFPVNVWTRWDALEYDPLMTIRGRPEYSSRAWESGSAGRTWPARPSGCPSNQRISRTRRLGWPLQPLPEASLAISSARTRWYDSEWRLILWFVGRFCGVSFSTT
jgi:hypothetical protein